MTRSGTELKRLTDNRAALLSALALAALVVVGGVLRVVFAGQDLFADELATYWIVKSNSLPDAIEAVGTTAEISPPLSFILTWLTTPISARLNIDLAPELIRLPALIAGIATIPLVYAVGIRTVGRGAALLAAALTTLSPFMILYSAEARGYGVMMALILLSTLTLLLAVDRERGGWWVAYAVFACAAAYTHYTSVFVLAAQLVWVLWTHPEARKAALIATGAAVLLYVPWIPSLKEDLDSPTTTILSVLAPFDLESIRVYLSHWAVGFPYPAGAPLRELPGFAGLGLMAASLVVGATAMYEARDRLRDWFAANDNRIVLVLALALATPVGAAVASLIGTNVYSARNLAASWPYLALAGAALVTVGDRRFRVAAAALAVAGFGFPAVKVVSADFERPNFSEVAEFVDSENGGVLVDAAAITPGPLTNFDVVGSQPTVEVLRLNAPAQKSEPFGLTDRLTGPSVVARQAVRAANGGPITLVSSVAANQISQLSPSVGETGASLLALEFIDELPPSYMLAERRLFEGFVELQVLVFEKRTAP